MRETIGNSERSLVLLKAMVCDGGRSSVSALARQIGMPVASAHRHVAGLVAAGFLVPSSYGRHLPGPELRSLVPLLDQREIMANAARPVLARLAAKSGTIAQLGVYENEMVTYLVKAGQSNEALFTKVGMQLEAYCSGIGKVLLAQLDAKDRLQYLANGPFIALTMHTITDPAELSAELDLIGEQGHAIDNEEIVLGLQCLAVPIRSGRGSVVGAISISRTSAPGVERWRDRMLPRLRAASEEITRTIG